MSQLSGAPARRHRYVINKINPNTLTAATPQTTSRLSSKRDTSASNAPVSVPDPDSSWASTPLIDNTLSSNAAAPNAASNVNRRIAALLSPFAPNTLRSRGASVRKRKRQARGWSCALNFVVTGPRNPSPASPDAQIARFASLLMAAPNGRNGRGRERCSVGCATQWDVGVQQRFRG